MPNILELGKDLTLMFASLEGPSSPSSGNNMSRTDCLRPRSTGYCKRYIVRWYFDGEVGVCRPFVYGGCGGNKNNFQTQEECRSSCSYAGILHLHLRIANLSGVLMAAGTQRPPPFDVLDFNTGTILGTPKL